MLESFLKEQNKKGRTVIYLHYSGSSLHGTRTENSDTDIKGVFVPSVEELILKEKNVINFSTGNKNSKNTKEDIDIELFSLKEFIRLLSIGDINAIELLLSFGTEFEISSPLVKREYFSLIAEKKPIVNKILAFTGFAMKQASLYKQKGDRLVELEEFLTLLQENKNKKLKDVSLENFLKNKKYSFLNGDYLTVVKKKYHLNADTSYIAKGVKQRVFGYGNRAHSAKGKPAEFKSLAHAVRAIKEGIELLETGTIKFPLSYASYLTSIKKGEVSVEKISEVIESDWEKLETLSQISSIPSNLNKEELDGIIIKITKECLFS
jgi:predicted nucleotidyltransferase